MISNIAPPQIRATTGLELAAGLFTKCSDELATQLMVSLTSGQKESAQTPLRIGINGDVYGGMRAPVEVGTRRVDIAYVNPSAMVTMAYRGKGYYKQKMALRVLGSFPSGIALPWLSPEIWESNRCTTLRDGKFRCASRRGSRA